MATPNLPHFLFSPYFLFWLLLLTALAGAVALLLSYYAAVVLDKLRQVIAAASLDLVQFFSAWNMAQLDATERRAKIEAATDTAAAELHHRIGMDNLERSGYTLKLGSDAHKLRLLQREGATK